MAKQKIKSGGGWPAIRYSLQMAGKAGGLGKLYRSLRNSNTCKTCAFGMGGMRGGMVNELGQSWQVCKKSMQAQSQDMQPGIPPDFFEKNSVGDLKSLGGRKLEALGRLAHPLYLRAGATHFKVLSWSEALDKLVTAWQAATPERSFFYTSGRSSMEAAFLVQLLAREWGSNNINNCSYYCHQASGVGLGQSLGGGTSTVELQDLRKADLVVLVGANPASNHPRLMTFLVELRRRGGKVVVINPFRELGLQRFNIPSDPRSLLFGSEVCDLYLQPHCGGDLALLKAAACLLWRDGQAEVDFLNNYTNHLPEFRKDLESEDVHELLLRSGVSREHLQKLCELLAQSQNSIFAWAMGITHHLQGVENVRAITNLALLRGMIGKPGAGLLPIRGHSNVQGVGTVGVVPTLKPAMAEALLQHLGVQVPEQAGMDTFSCMQAASAGAIDFALLMGGNLYGANPDLRWSAQALNRIGFNAYLSTTMNPGHVFGTGKETLILPVRAREEETQSTAQESMFNYVRLSKGGERAPSDDLLSESEILIHCAKALMVGSPLLWAEMSSHETIRKFISATVPNLASIKDLGAGKEFTIPQRIKHTPHFATDNGKANLAIMTAPDARPPAGWFNLMTFRSEGQFNTIIYDEEDIYRGASHRLVVFMNEDDMRRESLLAGQTVWVESEIGKMSVELLPAPIRSGNLAMYYPEANEIVPGKIDPQSRTPVFKKVLVKVTAA